VNDSEPNDDDDDGPDMRTDDTYIKAAFLNEMGKDRTLPSGFGPIGLAQLRELGERLQRRGVRELHAISREAHEATGEAFTGTAHAREQFTWSTARIARRHNVGDDASHHDMKKRPDLAPPEQLYALKPGQAYFVWNVNDLVRKLGKDGEDVRVRGGARLHVEERPCRLSGTARSWWEKDAIEDVILPRHTAETIDGVTYFTFDDEEEDELPADVEEGEEQSGANGYASTIERALAQKFGVKVSLDAAAVRRARKGRKHWTTVIVQILSPAAAARPRGRHSCLGGAQSPATHVRVRDLRDAAGAKEQKGQRGRLALVRKVRMFPSLMLCLDGGTREKPRVNTTAEMGAMGAEEEFTPTPVGLFAPSPEQEELHAREARAANAAANAANAAAGRVHDLPLVRLPALPEKIGTRALPDASWDDLDVIVRSALCILHAQRCIRPAGREEDCHE